MKLRDLLLSANASLLRNKARTFLTVVAIVIGAATLSLTSGIGSGIKAYLNKQVGNLATAIRSPLRPPARALNSHLTTTDSPSISPDKRKLAPTKVRRAPHKWH